MYYYLKDEIIRNVLEKIGFSNRYRALSNCYDKRNDSFEDYDNGVALEIIKKLGYSCRYYKSEDFFRCDFYESKKKYNIYFNISLKYGVCEFIWVVKYDGKVLIGSPWLAYSKELSGDKSKISKPAFRNYIELEAILSTAFEMYKEFKTELINIYEALEE